MLSGCVKYESVTGNTLPDVKVVASVGEGTSPLLVTDTRVFGASCAGGNLDIV